MSPTKFCALPLPFLRYKNLKFLTFKKVGQGHGVHILAKTPFDGKCQNIQMTPNICALALIISEIFTFEKLDGVPRKTRYGGGRKLFSAHSKTAP